MLNYIVRAGDCHMIIFQTQKLDLTMLYSSTITDTADEVLSTKKNRHILFTRLPGNVTLQFFISSPYTVDFSPLVKKLFKKGSFVPITSLAMADSAGPAGDMAQVAPEHSARDSSREKTPVGAP